MAIDLTLASASISYTSRTNSTVSKPASTVSGDDLLAVLYLESDSITPTAPDGWSLIASFDLIDRVAWCYVYHRRVDSSDDAASTYTWTHSSAGTQAAIKRYSGCDASTFEDCSESYATSAANPVVCPSITTVTDGAALVMIASSYSGGNYSSWSSPLAERLDIGQFGLADGIQTSAGSSGTMSATGTYSECGILLAIRPASTSSINQHSFRFFNDDGSESAATAKAALNTNINLSANDVARIRMLIDATGDPTDKQFQLEYRRKPSGGSFGDWLKVN